MKTKLNKHGDFFGFFFYVLYSTLLHLPPLRFHCVGGCWDRTMDEWTIKTPNPICRLFFKIDLLTDFAAFCLTEFIDWRYIHSGFVFSTQLVNCCPHGQRNYTCVLLPLYLLSDLPPPPKLNVHYIQTVCVAVWGGGGLLKCAVDHILQEFYTLFLTRFRTYKIASPPQTKKTSKDVIKGFVPLNFLRPWIEPRTVATSSLAVRSSALAVRLRQWQSEEKETALCRIILTFCRPSWHIFQLEKFSTEFRKTWANLFEYTKAKVVKVRLLAPLTMYEQI